MLEIREIKSNSEILKSDSSVFSVLIRTLIIADLQVTRYFVQLPMDALEATKGRFFS